MATTFVRNELVTVFGGSGFVGRHLVRALARRGYRVRAAVRRPDLAGHLQPLGAVGQIQPVQANLRNRESVERAIAGAEAVVNLVGILHESGHQRFEAVQAFGAGAVAQSVRAAGIRRFVQMSAIGADPDSDIAYQRTKAAGETAALEAVPHAVVTRPSIVFGPEDDFFNRFAAMARLSPVLPMIGGGRTRFQPVFVGDVAEAIAMAVDGRVKSGTVYELGGPEVKTFRELMQIMLTEIERKRILIDIPFSLARLQGRILQLLPKPLLTYDQVRMLEQDNIVSQEATSQKRTLEGLGIDPRAVETVLPTYLHRYRRTGQYTNPVGDQE